MLYMEKNKIWAISFTLSELKNIKNIFFLYLTWKGDANNLTWNLESLSLL